AGRVREKVHDATGAADEALTEARPALLSLLEALPKGDAFHALDPQERRQRTILALKQLLLRESAQQPTLLILQDLQWADSETLSCLDAIIASLPGARICLMLTYRPGYEHRWAGKRYYRELGVDPLPPASAEALLDALLGNDPSLGPLRRFVIE